MELTVGDDSERFTVVVDDLRAASKAPEVKKPIILHPSLQDIGTPLDGYDYDPCQFSFTRAVAEHMLVWAHAAAMSSVERVSVSRLSDL